MYVEELWRYPVKSLAGERLERVNVGRDGLQWDREVVVVNGAGKVTTSRTRPQLLALKGTTNADGRVFVDGHPWESVETRRLVQSAAGTDTRLVRFPDPLRFDILPLSVLTTGAVEYLGVDRRRFRPNILIGGVDGLAERDWEGRRVRIGSAVIGFAQLRGRCVMTTYDPDTQQQDLNVLRRIVNELEGTLSLDSFVVDPGVISAGDEVMFV